jgi:hypothetical protein
VSWGEAVDGLTFRVGFLDAGGALMRTVSIPAATVTSAAELAGEIATEIDAADFFLTAKPELTAKSARPQRAAHPPFET